MPTKRKKVAKKRKAPSRKKSRAVVFTAADDVHKWHAAVDVERDGVVVPQEVYIHLARRNEVEKKVHEFFRDNPDEGRLVEIVFVERL